MKKKLVVLTTCFTLLLTACSSSPAQQIADTVKESAKSSLPTDAPEPTATPEPEAPTLALGKKATVNDWKITVKKAEKKTKIKNGEYRVFEAKKDNAYVVITATARNNGKKEDTFLPRVGYEDKAVTATLYYKDYEYNPSDLLGYDKDLVAEKIKPLTSKSGIIVFEVPKKVANAKKDVTLKIGTKSNHVIYTLK